MAGNSPCSFSPPSPPPSPHTETLVHHAQNAQETCLWDLISCRNNIIVWPRLDGVHIVKMSIIVYIGILQQFEDYKLFSPLSLLHTVIEEAS